VLILTLDKFQSGIDGTYICIYACIYECVCLYT